MLKEKLNAGNVMQCAKISKWLQTENNPDPKKRVTLYTVRKVFDKLCEKYSFNRRQLSAAATIIHEPLFESAVAKLQGNDSSLTLAEKKKGSFYLIDNAEAESDENEDDVLMNFLEETLDDAAAESAKRQKKTCPYRSMDHISATSNIVERLFIRCGIIMRPHRLLMDPSTLEMLIMLRFNKDLWDAREVDEAMKRTTHTEIVSASSTPVPRSSLAGEMIVGASSSS